MRRWLLSLLFTLWLAIVLILTFNVISCSSTNSNIKTIYIYDVHDGDTFTYGNETHIRLCGVDTPEISDQYNGFAETEGIAHLYALQARDFARSLILNKYVTQELVTTDRYGREVSKIRIGNIDLAYELIKSGLARVAYMSSDSEDMWYSSDYSYYNLLIQAQYQAYYSNVGIWANKEIFNTIFPKAE